MLANRSKKVIILTSAWMIILISSIVIQSCCSSEDYVFEWKQISLDCLLKTVYENEKVFGDVTTDEHFLYEEFGIRINLSADLIAKNKFNLSLIEPALAAMDCFPTYSPKYKISEIQIESLNDFDIEKPKNSNVTDYFLASLYNGVLVDVDYYLHDKNEINGNGNSEMYLEQYIDLYLNKKPELDSIYRFVIKLNFDNGTVFYDTTNQVKIR